MNAFRRIRRKRVMDEARALRELSPGLPVEPGMIAQKLGIRVKPMDFPDETVSGAIGAREGVHTIAVNASHSPNRQRFTLAHELGHFCMHPQHMVVDRTLFRNAESSEGSSVIEMEANMFAAELLMPAGEVRSQAKGFATIGEREIDFLADRFGVSAMAMTIRLTRLRLLM